MYIFCGFECKCKGNRGINKDTYLGYVDVFITELDAIYSDTYENIVFSDEENGSTHSTKIIDIPTYRISE